MNSDIDNALLTHSSLINIARDYHQHTCTNGSECIIYEKIKPKMALRIAPVIGVDLSTLKKIDYEENRRYNLEPSNYFTLGMNMNFWLPRMNEKFFLQTQLLYTKYYFFDAVETPLRATDIHIHSNVLQIEWAIKYEYPKGKWRPTLAAGAAGLYLPDGFIKEFRDNYNRDRIRASTVEIDFPAKFWYGYGISPGVHYYLANERIVFIQLKYKKCYRHLNTSNIIESFSLSSGIYF